MSGGYGMRYRRGVGHLHGIVKIPQWQYTGMVRPPFAETPASGEESVWDYPRPPVAVADERLVTVAYRGRELARTKSSARVLETAGPPTFYLPFGDVDFSALIEISGSSFCEWKGYARYWALSDLADRGQAVGWDYPQPNATFAELKNTISFYPGRLECAVDGERVRPQDGGFYGGWITTEITGPIKGAPGTEGW